MSRASETSCTRRRFLARTLRLSVGALLASEAADLLDASPLGAAVGIQLYAVKEPLQADPARTLQTIRQIGFTEVETAGLPGLSAAQFHKLLEDAGLNCPSAHLQFDAGNLGPAFEQAHAAQAVLAR